MLREDAEAIWRAGVDAVGAERLVVNQVRVDGEWLMVEDQRWRLAEIDRIVVVGCGKAGAGMAAGLEQALGGEVARAKKLTGWLNVPADCLRPLEWLHLHAARPAGVNEPTEEGIAGAQRILELVESLGPRDLCICLISGGGSALLPAPIAGVSLADKQQVTRQLSAAGANIRELNTVRKRLSRIKGGGLARACRAGSLVTLVISDVLGDPLDIIASGPTVPDPSSPAEALAVIDRLLGDRAPPSVRRALRQAAENSSSSTGSLAAPAKLLIDYTTERGCRVSHRVIGNNAVAVKAATEEARRRGYGVEMQAASQLEGLADDIGVQLARCLKSVDVKETPVSHGAETVPARGPSGRCIVTGGEPVVRLADSSIRGKGGRNQQLVLAALRELCTAEKSPVREWVIMSGGTDGEDGPTDAAGAIADSLVCEQARRQGLVLDDYLARNDAYRFFERVGGLLKTGPTHTNVCDLRVLVWRD
jgi:glycerate 2-kinase